MISCTPVHGKAQCSPAHNQSINGPWISMCARPDNRAAHRCAPQHHFARDALCTRRTRSEQPLSESPGAPARGVADVDAGSMPAVVRAAANVRRRLLLPSAERALGGRSRRDAAWSARTGAASSRRALSRWVEVADAGAASGGCSDGPAADNMAS